MFTNGSRADRAVTISTLAICCKSVNKLKTYVHTYGCFTHTYYDVYDIPL